LRPWESKNKLAEIAAAARARDGNRVNDAFVQPSIPCSPWLQPAFDIEPAPNGALPHNEKYHSTVAAIKEIKVPCSKRKRFSIIRRMELPKEIEISQQYQDDAKFAFCTEYPRKAPS